MKEVLEIIGSVEDWIDYPPHTLTSVMPQKIVDALAAAGYFICRMEGGIHAGNCPTCGCEVVTGEKVG